MTTSSRGSGLGASMAGGNPDAARGREEDDFYPTPVDVTLALTELVHSKIYGRVVWEPCAGDGAMARILAARGASVLASDISPRQPDVTKPFFEGKINKLDFLQAKRLPDPVRAVITNPPFNLAVPIIEHVFNMPNVEQLDIFALVLKSTFWHAASRNALFRKHRPAIIAPLLWRPDFLDLGRPTMEVMWCVWCPRDYATPGTQRTTQYWPLQRPGTRTQQEAEKF